MKKTILVLCTLCMIPLLVCAGETKYTFTSLKWASTVGAIVCDGKTDGWICDKEASEYNAGRVYADGSLHMAGVSVKTGTSGAGATSVQEFTEVRRVIINFCQNSSKGRGVIHVQVGENEGQTIVVNKPVSGQGDINRDSVIVFKTPLTGKIKFWVECSENAINIHSIAILSASGGSSVFTVDTYQLVTNVNQLEDSDQVIFGVYKEGVNYIMGYFDEYESANNIHAIKGRYSADRSQVDADESAIYTLRITDLNGQKAYVFQDELRYEEAYLVASGGQTKNRLAVWTDVVDEKTFGNYGFWNITIENGGEAVITNMGNSKAKIIQYNASNNPTLFSCYADRSQTPVCLYRRVPAIGDVSAIIAPLVNFGTTIESSGSRTIQVNANKLSADISVTLKNGKVFSLSSNTLDRDGDALTISYQSLEAGHYNDTLEFVSDETRTEAAVLLTVQRPLSVSEAVHLEDYAVVYLNDVIVTKKYDKYIYIRDETGSMMIFDRGNGQGAYYGSNLKAGDPLSGVTGRFINYFGVPEISPTEQFKIGQNQEVLPEPALLVIDSADVCRYLVLENAVVTGWTSLTYNGKDYAVDNKFKLSSFDKDEPTRTFVIVSYDYDVVTLYIVKQERYSSQGIDETGAATHGARLIMREGVVLVETDKGYYTLQGEEIL